jgi:hypothetical protein
MKSALSNKFNFILSRNALKSDVGTYTFFIQRIQIIFSNTEMDKMVNSATTIIAYRPLNV